MSDQDISRDPGTRKVVWVMASVMALSFVFGVGMFLPAEHRADKLSEMSYRYQERRPGTNQTKPIPKKRLYFGKED